MRTIRQERTRRQTSDQTYGPDPVGFGGGSDERSLYYFYFLSDSFMSKVRLIRFGLQCELGHFRRFGPPIWPFLLPIFKCSGLGYAKTIKLPKYKVPHDGIVHFIRNTKFYEFCSEILSTFYVWKRICRIFIGYKLRLGFFPKHIRFFLAYKMLRQYIKA